MSVAFLWCDKAIMRRIRERLEDSASALCVYVALCEIASDEAKEEFTATQAHIAAKAGLGVRTVAKRLQDLDGLGVITMCTPELKAPSRFTLLSSTGNRCRTIGSECGTIGNRVRNQLPTVEEREEREERKTPKLQRPIPTGERITLEKQEAQLAAEVKKLEGLRHHERKANHQTEVEGKRETIRRIRSRLAQSAEASL
jgi:DNA-binding Lrp family transcriptional regulator